MTYNTINLLAKIDQGTRKDPHFVDKMVGIMSIKYPEILTDLIEMVEDYDRRHHVGDDS